MARYPEFVPSDEQRNTVRQLTLIATPLEVVARCILNPATGKGISVKVLRRAFQEELETSRMLAKAQVVAAIFRQALRGNVTAGIWLTKNWLGYSDKPEGGEDWEARSVEKQEGRKNDRSLADLSTAELARLYRDEG